MTENDWVRAIDWERLGKTGKDWERLRKTENDWVARQPRQRDDGTTGRRDGETAGLRDCGTTGLRDHGTTRLRDHGTTRLRDVETARLRDYGTTEKHRRSQAFSVVLSCAWQLGVRVVQMWCQVEVWLDGGVLGVHPHSDERAWCRRCAAITSSYHDKHTTLMPQYSTQTPSNPAASSSNLSRAMLP